MNDTPPSITKERDTGDNMAAAKAAFNEAGIKAGINAVTGAAKMVNRDGESGYYSTSSHFIIVIRSKIETLIC